MTPEAYETFRHDAVHALMALNDHCNKAYRLAAWPRYDYDLDAGTLTFSEAGVPKVVISVQVVGSTLETRKEWLWGWDNENLPPPMVARLKEVRQFGETEAISQLTRPTLPDDEHLGWEMTAVTARIIGGKGGYRVPRRDADGATVGYTYFVYTDLRWATADDVANAAATPIECDRHGKGRATFICEHLRVAPAQVWHSNDPISADPWPDAWCSACEEVFQEQGEWNERNEGRAPIVAVCHHCYADARRQATG